MDYQAGGEWISWIVTLAGAIALTVLFVKGVKRIDESNRPRKHHVEKTPHVDPSEKESGHNRLTEDELYAEAFERVFQRDQTERLRQRLEDLARNI